MVFSPTAPEERQHSESGEFLRSKAIAHGAGSGLGSQTSWAPAPFNSNVTLGKSIIPHSQSADWG